MYAEMSTSAKSIKKNLWWPHTKQPSLLWLCNYCNCQQYAQYNSIHFFFTKLQDQKNESCFDDIKKKVWRNGPLQFWCFEYLNGISIQTLNKNSFRDIFANILLEQCIRHYQLYCHSIIARSNQKQKLIDFFWQSANNSLHLTFKNWYFFRIWIIVLALKHQYIT